MADAKYVLFTSSSGHLQPVEILTPKVPPSKLSDELYEIAKRIEDISDEIEDQTGLVKDLRNCSWLLRAVVLGKIK
jgi:hypothetical protein